MSAMVTPPDRDDGIHSSIERTLGLSPAVLHRLHDLAVEEGAGLDVALLAALVALLARYAGQASVEVVAEVAQCRGAVASIIARSAGRVVRADLSGEPDVRGLIRRVKISLDEAAQEDDVPIQSLPGVAGDPRGLGGNGDRVTFAFDEATLLPRRSQRLAVRRADLALLVTGASDDPDSPFDARLVFCARRFDGGAADRICGHLRRIVEGMASSGGAASAIPIVGDEERAWILGCSGVHEVRWDERHESVVRLFEAHVARAPDAVAVVDGERTLTYQELDSAANSLAHRLRGRGVGVSSLVALYMERGANAVVSFLGILKARGTYVPIDTSYPACRVAAILESARPRVVITREELAAQLPPPEGLAAACSLLCLDAIDDLDADVGADGARSMPEPNDAAYVIFTSGSTGRPKGVVVDHRSLSNYARASVDAYGFHSRDRVLQGASLGFDLSLEEIVVTLTAGAALVVRSAPPVQSIQAFLDECVERGVTILSITSALWHELTALLANRTVSLPPLLRLVILGADIARPDVLSIWQRATQGRVRLVNSYGLTETTIVATVWEATNEALGEGWRAVPIGRPLRNVSAYVLDARDELAPIGVPGEICIGGMAVASGYLGDEALTSSRFVPDPFIPGERMYRTGDRGRLRSCGGFEFLGRLDYQVKVGGIRVELGEIEARLREIAGVVEAVVVARTNNTSDTELSAHVIASSTDVTPASLRLHLARVLPGPTVPAQIHVADRLPLTPAGKIDRRALAALVKVDARCAEFVAPSTPLEALVAATVAEVLGLSRLGMLDSFVLLGGNSLAAIRAASILGKYLGQRVRAQILLESRTLRESCVQLGARAQRDLEIEPTRSLERDARLDPMITPRIPPDGPAPLATVLLTGATGFFGAFVLADLLRDTTAHVLCLVRASSADAARARIVESLDRRRCRVDAAVLATRVSVIVGDIGLPQLGLDDATWSHLGDTVDAIFHLGARVNMLLPYDALFAMNVLAVESVLRLATTGRSKTVHHISTVEVLSDMDPAEPAALSERSAATSPTLLHDGYGQSKWVAERLVGEARARGICTFIHRPGRLTGHSESGVFNADDFLVRMLDACGQVGAAPILDVLLDVTPVDYASRALVRLAQLEPAEGDAFHLVSPSAVRWSSFVDQVIALGYPLRAVPHEEWCSLLERRAPSSARGEFLLYLAGMSKGEAEASIHGGYASHVTQAWLGREIVCPPVDARLVATYLARLAEEGLFPPPNRPAACERT